MMQCDARVGAPNMQTLQPVVTGTSVLGIVCADGVLMCADTLGTDSAHIGTHRIAWQNLTHLAQVRTDQWHDTEICAG
jgi:hypothetical protein